MKENIKNRTSSNLIEELKENEIFVFGSNLSGIHGSGAAKTANEKFGAKMGIGVGISNQSYAIPTKDKTVRRVLSLKEISYHVETFIKYARNNPNLTFLVTEIGCGLAGYNPKEIAPLFKKAIDLENIHLPERFWKILKQL